MGDRPSNSSAATPRSIPPPPPLPPPPRPVTLIHPSSKKKNKPVKVIRAFRNAFRSFPIITTLHLASLPDGKHGGGRVTGTLFGYRKGRISLSIQKTPSTFPMVVVELGMQTQALQKELSQGLLRIAMEGEKRPEKDKTPLLDEPIWTMYANGKKNGHGVRREAREDDLYMMEVLKGMSMGAGVLPVTEAEMSYMRWQFDRVVGSKDSETLYMFSPEGAGYDGTDLTIFFIRKGKMVNIVVSMKKGLVNLVEVVSCGSRGAKGDDVEEPKKLKIANKSQVTVARGETTADKPGGSDIEST